MAKKGIFIGGFGRGGEAAAPPTPGYVTSGLDRYFDINEATSYPGSGGTVNDISGNAKNGTLYNTYSYNAVNNSIDTTGTDANGGYMGFEAPLPFSSDFTFEIGIEQESGLRWYWTSRSSTGGYGWTSFSTVIYTIADYPFPTSVTNAMPTNTPYVFTFVANGTAGTADIFVDGVLIDSGFTYGTNRPSVSLDIPNYALIGGNMPNGTSVVPSATSPMKFYYHRLYNRQLTGGEVIQNFDYNKAAMGL